MFIGVHVNFHESEVLATRVRLEPDGSVRQPYIVTVSLSASLVVNVTELSSNTVHRVSVPLPSTLMKGRLLSTTKIQRYKACVVQWQSVTISQSTQFQGLLLVHISWIHQSTKHQWYQWWLQWWHWSISLELVVHVGRWGNDASPLHCQFNSLWHGTAPIHYVFRPSSCWSSTSSII